MSQSSPLQTPPKAVWQRLLELGPAVWLATGGWVGLIPVMPGTIGALWGIPLGYALAKVPQPAVQLLAIGLIALIGVPICDVAARRLGLKDPGAVVFDEIVGMLVTYFLHPVHNPAVLVAGFLLFRIFDIAKPPPVRQAERFPGGWGIMADDIVAGVYANLSLWLATWLGLFTMIGNQMPS